MLIIKTEEDRERCTSCYDYTGVKSHVEDHITVIDSARLVSMSIVPKHGVADENLKVRRVEPNAEN